MPHTIELLRMGSVTHNVMRLVTTRPEEFDFQPGQGVELSLDEPGWTDQGRPFSPTSRREDKVLEFTIKRYDDHDAVTRKLSTLTPGAQLKLAGPFGAITYKGKGVYIAGGAGITPFLAQLRTLAAQGALAGHTLLFSNRYRWDVIDEHELTGYLGDAAIFTLTSEAEAGYEYGRIDRSFLQRYIEDFNQYFYICGPPAFTTEICDILSEMGADSQRVIVEG